MRLLIIKKNRKLLRKVFFVLVVTPLVISLYLFFKSGPLQIKNIIVTTDFDINNNQKLTQILNNTKGQNILLLNEQNLVNQIKKTDIKINNVQITKQLLGKVVINIIKKQPLAAVTSGSRYLLIDQNGLFYDETQPVSNLPIINFAAGLQNIKVGSRIEGRDKEALEILASLVGKEQVTTVSVEQEKIQVELGSKTNVLFPIIDNITSKISALQTILARFRIEGKTTKTIDLRFEKPVITF